VKIADIIAAAKQQEQPEITLILAGDKRLPIFILAWVQSGHHCPGIHDDASTLPDDCPDPLLAVWEDQAIDYDYIALLAGQPVGICRQYISRLIGLRLIYPDGTASDYAMKYIRIIAAGLLKRTAGKK